MIDRVFDPTLPHRYSNYGRMSDPRTQNQRSPDQQFDTIHALIFRNRYPWIEAGSYRDGHSGRYTSKRPGLQQLLRDIEIGVLKIDLLLVDTLERLGRSEDIAELRRRGHLVEVGSEWSEGRLVAAARDGDRLKAAANARGMQGYAAGR